MTEYSNRSRLLFLLGYLMMNTDKEHFVCMNKLMELMAKNGFSATEKTLRGDIANLANNGFNITTEKRNSTACYYYADRTLSDAQIRVLIDATTASQFISAEDSEQIIEQLVSLSSVHSAEKLKATVSFACRAKSQASVNVVATLNDAILKQRQITFQYWDYNEKRERVLKDNGKVYTVTPYSLVVCNDRYYMPSWNPARDKVVYFRVDRICEPKMLDTTGRPLPEDFDLEGLTREVFIMYDGTPCDVVLECKNTRMKNLVDRYNEDFEFWPVSDTTFQARIHASVSKMFFAWVFEYAGSMRIVSPDNVRNEYRDYVQKALEHADQLED